MRRFRATGSSVKKMYQGASLCPLEMSKMSPEFLGDVLSSRLSPADLQATQKRGNDVFVGEWNRVCNKHALSPFGCAQGELRRTARTLYQRLGVSVARDNQERS